MGCGGECIYSRQVGGLLWSPEQSGLVSDGEITNKHANAHALASTADLASFQTAACSASLLLVIYINPLEEH